MINMILFLDWSEFKSCTDRTVFQAAGNNGGMYNSMMGMGGAGGAGVGMNNPLMDNMNNSMMGSRHE